MKALKGALIAAGVGAVMAALSAAPASADTFIDFTWNPGVVTGAPGTTQEFQAAGFQIADYAKISLNAASGPGVYNNVQESAILVLNSISAFGSTPGFINGTGAGTLPTDYQIYFLVTATSTLAPAGGGAEAGTFNSFTYTMVLDKGGKATFNSSIAGVSPNANGDAQITLATGTLAPSGPNSVGISGAGVPSATADATISPDGGAAGFFVDPSVFTGIVFDSIFTNTNASTIQTVDGSGNPVFIIGQTVDPRRPAGGGNVDMLGVPEPLTLSVFGAGLAGAAFARRRKSKKA